MNMHNALNTPETGPPLTAAELELCKEFLDDIDLLNGFLVKYREGDIETRYWFIRTIEHLSREAHTNEKIKRVLRTLHRHGVIEATAALGDL